MTTKILVWGAGAIGGTVGAFLARAGHEVTFVDVLPGHVAAISDPALGLTVGGPVAQFTVTAPAFLPQELTGRWELVLLCVKGQDTASAARALMPHLAADGAVVSMQNGLCAGFAEEILGEGRVIAASFNFAGDWIKPGQVLFGARGALALGELDGRKTDRVARIVALLRDFEPAATASSDIQSWIWGKLGFGAMLTAHAVGRASIVDCFSRSELIPLWRILGDEIAAIAARQGAHPHAFDAYDPAAFTLAASEDATREGVKRLVEFSRHGAKTHSGIWRDLAVHRRRTEVSAQLGPVVEIGRAHGLDCPTLSRLLWMVGEIEAGKRRQDDLNLNELMTGEMSPVG
ncbi:2-dehydropantoate 2-reductase [Rhizobiales bacterium GAS191]|nr:2-dehydropantoate 2-reductase [Rhizobiales bacterium GAS191]